ncbi:sulfurtransferase complex subunit TusD [Psychrobacter sp. CAL346-MNA-CIBAN-0220]|uniref:sulfurtransferase complex subunit TusD n=1 Tax=Psychrobacter sp. CAL346-MNA-CIBAN-0220 TaxID=3140457 RepID=UPI00332ECFB4
MTPLLLITVDPSRPLAHLALRYARALLEQVNATDNHSDNTDRSTNNEQPLNVFFYADAAHTANRLRWQSADQSNLTKQWQALAEQYKLPLPVCVSTALSRGISDTDNSARHQLLGDNIAEGFHLVGLSELAMMMQSNCRLIQF